VNHGWRRREFEIPRLTDPPDRDRRGRQDLFLSTAHRLRSFDRNHALEQVGRGGAELVENTSDHCPVPGRNVDQARRSGFDGDRCQQSGEHSRVPLGCSGGGQKVAAPSVSRLVTRIVAVLRVVEGEVHENIEGDLAAAGFDFVHNQGHGGILGVPRSHFHICPVLRATLGTSPRQMWKCERGTLDAGQRGTACVRGGYVL
jgi:hypothetical protein